MQSILPDDRDEDALLFPAGDEDEDEPGREPNPVTEGFCDGETEVEDEEAAKDDEDDDEEDDERE